LKVDRSFRIILWSLMNPYERFSQVHQILIMSDKNYLFFPRSALLLSDLQLSFYSHGQDFQWAHLIVSEHNCYTFSFQIQLDLPPPRLPSCDILNDSSALSHCTAHPRSMHGVSGPSSIPDGRKSPAYSPALLQRCFHAPLPAPPHLEKFSQYTVP
jgi:hypothetical protein